MLNGWAMVQGLPLAVGEGVVRHIYLLGFITQLICGVSVRTLPGFLGKRAVACPSLVAPMFWLVNAATVLRVVPLILPSAAKDLTPAVGQMARVGFGLSGVVALAAVILLAISLVGTMRTDR
jgi:heme/copper-type cytochrome/quinol oxidase subunit 1